MHHRARHDLGGPARSALGRVAPAGGQAGAATAKAHAAVAAAVAASSTRLLLPTCHASMSVLASGQSTPNLDSFSPRLLLEEVSAFYREAAEKKGLGFDLVWTTPAPESAESDPVKVRQLLENLIGNAVKFRREGLAPRIVVDCTAGTGEDAENWVFTVSDNGIGIAEEFVDKVFVIFQRLHGRTDYEGTGVGLAVCRRIVERHGGRIWAHSQPNRGSDFYFTLTTGSTGNH